MLWQICCRLCIKACLSRPMLSSPELPTRFPSLAPYSFLRISCQASGVQCVADCCTTCFQGINSSLLLHVEGTRQALPMYIWRNSLWPLLVGTHSCGLTGAWAPSRHEVRPIVRPRLADPGSCGVGLCTPQDAHWHTDPPSEGTFCPLCSPCFQN